MQAMVGSIYQPPLASWARAATWDLCPQPMTQTAQTVRILMAKFGESYEEEDLRFAFAFREAGFEVIYMESQSPGRIASAAVQEDVDFISISCFSGAYRYLYFEVTKLLKEKGADDITVIGGGIIPDKDFQLLYDAGLKVIFTFGASPESIINWINTKVKSRSGLSVSETGPIYKIEKRDFRMVLVA